MATTTTLTANADARFGRPEFDISAVVDAIGSNNFADALLAYFDRICGADYCVVFRQTNSTLIEVSSSSGGGAEGDELHVRSYDVRRQFSLTGAEVRINVATVQQDNYSCVHELHAARHQRLLLSVHKPSGGFCIGFARSARRPTMTGKELAVADQVAPSLLSAVAKHCNLTTRQQMLGPTWYSLSQIEERLITMTALSRREREVSARMLYGLSTAGIALDLGIGEESVATYRKRSYHRLGISNQRELLILFLSLPACNAQLEPE